MADRIDAVLTQLPAVAAARADAVAAAVAPGAFPYPLGSGEAEERALLAGIKPALRQLLAPDRVAAQRARFEGLGLSCAVSAFEPTHGTGDRGERRAARPALIVADTPARAARLMACEQVQHELGARDRLSWLSRRRVRAAVAEQGTLLGYPPCCVARFARHTYNLGAGTAVAQAEALRRTRGACAPRLNATDLAVFHYVAWAPCALDCGPSRAAADRVAEVVAADEPGFVRRVDEALAVHRIVVADAVQLSVRGRAERSRADRGRADRGRVEVEALWATARDRHPRARLPDRAAAAVGRLLARLVGAREVAVDRRGLVADGERILALPGIALFPFG